MDSGFYSAFTGLAARMQSLDLLANNLANVNTAGYKAQKEFYRAFTASLQQPRAYPCQSSHQRLRHDGRSARRSFRRLAANHGQRYRPGARWLGIFRRQHQGGHALHAQRKFQPQHQRQLVDSQGNLVQGQDGTDPSALRQTHYQHRRNSFGGWRAAWRN